ncbi:hypothetical protein SE916_01385 [Pseudomonas sp. 5FOS]|jgi:hypothetical protein|uniref:hypothetical protein n=1 Tax=unclassified Pseudomonas TaxID=196821 RepID=UPI000EE9BB83|nr:hypothetical protein [Pseudomonas sp. LS.1a]RFQ02576.1 hypothetical protein D0O09_11840 [Pseudomonas putida]UMY59775.1 hypothetical protein MKK04_16260 [Pseudomonas sp. LS.1a]
MVNSVVSISEQAFFSIVTSALEAYKVEHLLENGDFAARVETYGHLWGYAQKSIGAQTMYRVVWADTCTSVTRDQGSISYGDAPQEIKQSFIDTFFPEVTFLGDYHSHPYSYQDDEIKTELELERGGYYRFSDADFRSVKQQQDDGLDYRVGLVATVFERDEKVKRALKILDGESALRFQVGSMTIWLKAYVWTEDENLKFRRKADRMVRLVCPSLNVFAGMRDGWAGLPPQN